MAEINPDVIRGPALASTTATAVKTSLLKWIRVFSNFVAFIPNLSVGKCPEMISWGPYSNLEKEWDIPSRLFTSSKKREIGHFHAEVVQWRAKLFFR